jgi:hypothetical protein
LILEKLRPAALNERVDRTRFVALHDPPVALDRHEQGASLRSGSVGEPAIGPLRFEQYCPAAFLTRVDIDRRRDERAGAARLFEQGRIGGELAKASAHAKIANTRIADDTGDPDRFDVYYGMGDSRIGVASIRVPKRLSEAGPG